MSRKEQVLAIMELSPLLTARELAARAKHLSRECVRVAREQRVHRMPPGPERWRERSRTYEGIANAMAEQWGQ